MSETEQIIETITAALRGAHNRLWTVMDIGEHFGCSKSTVYRIAAKPGFPEPVNIPGMDSQRWVSEEVKEWVKQQRASKRKGRGRPRLVQP